ncbi:MAG: FtsX-like permease family protein [Nitrososphaerota archaeon]|nr:FtsX-like permease family protein [Nitrososphaerota archaeon]
MSLMVPLMLLGGLAVSAHGQGSDSLLIMVVEEDNTRVRDGLKFTLYGPAGVPQHIETKEGFLVVPVAAWSRIVGPVVDGGEEYIPIDLWILEPIGEQQPIVLKRARVLRLVELYPWIDGRPVKAHYRLELEKAGPSYPDVISWSHGIDGLKELVGLSEGEILVPLMPGFRLVGEFEVLGGDVSWTAELTNLVREAQQISLLQVIYPHALAAVEGVSTTTRYGLERLAESGIYLGYQLSKLRTAEQKLSESKEAFERGLLAEAYHLLRKAYVDVVGVNSVLSSYGEGWTSGGVLLPLFMVLGALTLSHLVLSEKRSVVLAGLSFLSIVTFGYMAATFPAMLPSDAWGWSILLYSVLITLGLIWSIPSLSLEVKTYRGVALLAASTLAFSVAKRFLKTRPLRTWMMVAMATITVSSTLLLLNTSLEGNVFVSSPLERVSPPGIIHIVAYSRDYRYDNPAHIETRYTDFIRSLGLKVGLRAETPIAPPSGREYFINYRSYYLRGVIGVDGETPLSRQLSGCIVEGNLEGIRSGSQAAIISSDLAANIGETVGSEIDVNGLPLKVVGILSTDCPTYIKDVDGYFVSTLVQPPMSTVTPAGWSNIVITGFEEARRLGAIPTKIYATGGGDREIYRLAETISLHTNLKVSVIESDGRVFVFNFVGLTGISGGEVLIVAGIAFLNLLVASLANYYERRGEFFTMSTLGLNPGHILLLSAAEALLLSIVASYLGILVTLGVLGIAPRVAPIPIDFKLSPESAFGVLVLSSVIFVSSHLFSVRKSIILSTPAQTWKWALTKTLDEEGYWTIDLPARVKASKIRHFITYMSSRLSEYSYTTTVNINVLGIEERPDLDVYRLKFIYSSTEQRAFRAICMLEVCRQGEWSSVLLRTKIEAQDARFVDQYIREVAQLIRQFIIEYTSLTIRILVPFGRDTAYLQPLLSVYNPSEVKLVWRGDSEEGLQRAVELLERNTVRVDVVRLGSSDSLVSDTRAVIEAARGCDLICISSDDGYLSSIALLTAQRLDKRICIVRDSNVVEATPTSLFEQLR